MTGCPSVESKANIWQTFEDISEGYDRVNRLLSLGLDMFWRRQLIRMLPSQNDPRVLDLATGTADLLISLKENKRTVSQAVGIDLSEKMLAVGQKKIERAGLSEQVFLKKGDMHELPFADNEFDVVTAAFGLRNAADPQKVLREIYRVLRPGGRVFILEFSLSKQAVLRRFQQFYLERVVPFVGGRFAGNTKAYRYLCESIKDFPSHEEFCVVIRDAGFAPVCQRILFPDITSIYAGQKGA